MPEALAETFLGLSSVPQLMMVVLRDTVTRQSKSIVNVGSPILLVFTMREMAFGTWMLRSHSLFSPGSRGLSRRISSDMPNVL